MNLLKEGEATAIKNKTAIKEMRDGLLQKACMDPGGT